MGMDNPSFHGWRMVALAFMASNIGLNVVITTFGPAMPVLERELGASRAGVSVAFGIMMLMLGVLAPLVGGLAQRGGLRRLMVAGALINAAGFLLLAFAGSLWMLIAGYGFIIGTGACILSIIGAPTLICRWFEKDRGKALGIGLMPALGLVAAPVAAWLAVAGGGRLLFLVLAGLFMLLVPFMFLVIDRPEQVGQIPLRQQPATPYAGNAVVTGRAPVPILTDWRFWVLSLSIGCLSVAGLTLGSHAPAMAAAKGVELTTGAMLLSAVGAGAILGSPGFGWLIDRVGPFNALAAALFSSGMLWAMFAFAPTMSLLLPLSFIMGFTLGGTLALHSACLNDLFGSGRFSRAMGMGYLAKAPFVFGAAPLAGFLYDLAGGYGWAYLVCATVPMIGALAALLLAGERRRRTLPAP